MLSIFARSHVAQYVLAGCSLAFCAALGCSSSNKGSGFSTEPGQLGGPDGGQGILQGGQPDSGNNNEAGPGGGECIPDLAMTTATFTPEWVNPAPIGQNKCSCTDLNNYYDACLAGPINQANCDAFTSAHPACAACATSNETDSAWGPVVWKHNHSYTSVNIGGCLQQVNTDSALPHCGQAYNEVVSCQQQSCDGCWASSSMTYNQFANCEAQAADATPCQTFADTWKGQCADTQQAPLVNCIPIPGSTAKTAYVQVAGVFCSALGAPLCTSQ